MLAAAAAAVVVAAALTRPVALVALLAVPLAVAPLRAVLGGAGGRALLPVLRDTGRLELAYGVLLGLGPRWPPDRRSPALRARLTCGVGRCSSGAAGLVLGVLGRLVRPARRRRGASGRVCIRSAIAAATASRWRRSRRYDSAIETTTVSPSSRIAARAGEREPGEDGDEQRQPQHRVTQDHQAHPAA